MFIQSVFSLPIWVLFVEITVYAAIVLFLVTPLIRRNIRVRRQINMLKQERDERIEQSVRIAQRLRSAIEYSTLDSNEKRRRTVLERYGVEYAFQWTPNEKRRRTMLERYGTEYAFNLPKLDENKN
jgi:hypothetical protein